MVARLHRILAIAMSSLLAACRATHPGEPVEAAISPTSNRAIAVPDAWGNPYAGQRRTVDGHTYTTDLVEARLGPHRLRFPANFYYDQIGPDFQGGIALVLLWPDLVPAAPGEDFHDNANLFARYISIYPDYVDKVPIEGYLDRQLQPSFEFERGDPTESIDLRIHGEPIHGLTPYYTDFDKVKAWARQKYGDRGRNAADPSANFNNDWYVVRNAGGDVVTFISCTAREVPDGVRFENGRLVERRAPVALCEHHLTVPERRWFIRLGYKRAALKDWQRIEQRVRDLFAVAQGS